VPELWTLGVIVRAIRYSIITIFGLAALWYMLPFRLFWSFDHIEQHAKKVITGIELQDWAAKILAQHPVPPGDYLILRRSELLTPLPKPLLGLYHNPPDIFVYETTTNSPGYIMLMWGGGVIGHCGFEIGPTNFVRHRGKHKWQDGVYFWSED
jgi:hypothetical protein